METDIGTIKRIERIKEKIKLLKIYLEYIKSRISNKIIDIKIFFKDTKENVINFIKGEGNMASKLETKKRSIDTIVFSGAVAYGVAFVGAYDKLLDLGFEFRNFAGVSAGSIVALTTSLFSKTLDKDKRKNLLKEFNIKEMYDVETGSLGKFKLIWNIITEGGGFTGKGLEKEIGELIEMAGLSRNTTFAELYDATQNNLEIFVFEGTEYKFIKLSKDTTPSFKVLDACLISSLFPIHFKTKTIKLKDKELVFMDGGMYNWFPLDQYDKEKSIGVTLKLGLGANFSGTFIEKALGYIDVSVDRIQELLLEKYQNAKRKYIVIDLGELANVGAFDFDKFTEEYKDKLYEKGYLETSLSNIYNF